MSKTFHITTFGCQMNEHDSEIMAGLLCDMGMAPVKDRKDANIAIINTCSVRDNADKRFFGTLGQLKRRKMQDPDFYVCVCGCMMQQQRVIDQIQKKYPWVDLIFGTHNIERLPHLLRSVMQNHDQEMEILDGGADRSIPEHLPMKRLYKEKALVNITFGCNNFCTYCIVPYTRGREISRKPEEILKEIQALADDGVREVMLLGQNVNSYKGEYELPETAQRAVWEPVTEEDKKEAEKTSGYCTFSHLIRLVAEIDVIKRIRFMTSHPKDLSPELIDTFKTCDKLCKNIHLPVQSGSDRILKKMNRHYDREKYLSLVERLKKAVPDITISTDIIVGFPGETEEDFQDTLDIVRRVQYDSAFTFLYSIRKGTPAASYEDQIPEDVKHERFNRLVDEVNASSAEKNKAYEGTVQTIMIEGKSKRNKQALCGRTDGFKLVNFSVLPEDLPEQIRRGGRSVTALAEAWTGKFAEVEITQGKTFSLEGRLIAVMDDEENH